MRRTRSNLVSSSWKGQITVDGSRVTSVQKRIKPQKSFSGASVDPTEARNSDTGS
jgi:hypothetical protein